MTDRTKFHRSFRDLCLSGTTCLLVTFHAGCSPVKKSSIQRTSQENGPVEPSKASGNFPQLQSPSVAMRTECAKNVGLFDCAVFPWSIENYNKVAALVDASGSVCSHHIFVGAAAAASLLNQPAAEGTPLTTVFPATRLEVMGPIEPGTVSFVQVKYLDGSQKSFGDTAKGESPVFIDRTLATCQIPSSAVQQEQVNQEAAIGAQEKQENATSASERGSSLSSKTSSGHTGTQTHSMPDSSSKSSAADDSQNRGVSKMSCRIDVPLHAKLWPWATPKCDKDDGTAVNLKRQDEVTLKRSPENGTPVTYFAYQANGSQSLNCKIKRENIELKTCKPL